MSVRRFIVSSILLVIFIWLIWSFAGRSYPPDQPETFLDIVEEVNPSDSLYNNIVGIQPYMLAKDYIDQETFYRKMELYLDAARKSQLIHSNTVVLLPEYVGTWLVLSGEKHVLAEKDNLKDAMSTLVLSNIVDFVVNYFQSHELDRPTGTLFRMKARKMAEDYFNTFSQLAQQFNCYIAAGSIILPQPYVEEGELYVDKEGPLYNASFIFGPDGKIIGEPVLKAFPIESEIPFVSGEAVEKIPVFNLPMGKTALLICADSWYPEPYQVANQSQTEIILVPSYLTGDEGMKKPWQGYNGAPAPVDTNLNDIEKISEWEAWNKYALPGRIGQTNARIGLNVFLRGELWNLGADGQPLAVLYGHQLELNPANRAGIWSINF
ncbi:nitrilase-related carbon-nitrogen hydrolase [Algoriphagus limi]|uniref:Carbon-nitrogen hydrolase n=1 Tax=Algoriphagus limi TaxID=2975273 RepID=A0ABT2G3X5_9BACT|nr:nitrilase-related carbon-nitrogen hydrolase [Algoriphagus limi]MCS5489964.1 carbon-nitrogen hydrolase [Algoriphagus limi]